MQEQRDPKYYWLETCEVKLAHLPFDGWILDIGGGGEGVIGQLMGSQVVAIDRRMEELEEAAPGPLKIVMDAGDLKFLDETFSAITAFFCLMYIREEDSLRMILREAYRVLKPGGQLWVWDASIPKREGITQEVFVVPVQIELPDGKRIETGYGQRWPKDVRDGNYYERLAAEFGFESVSLEEGDAQMMIKFMKPV